MLLMGTLLPKLAIFLKATTRLFLTSVTMSITAQRGFMKVLSSVHRSMIFLNVDIAAALLPDVAAETAAVPEGLQFDGAAHIRKALRPARLYLSEQLVKQHASYNVAGATEYFVPFKA